VRRHPVGARRELLGRGDVADRRPVETADRPEGVQDLVLHAPGTAPDEPVGVPEQGRGVAVLGVGQGLRQPGPSGAAGVERFHHRGVEAGAVDRASAVSQRRQRRARGARPQTVVGPSRVAVVVERTRAVECTLAEEVSERVLEAARLTERHVGTVVGRVDRAVQHERAHPVREFGRVDGREVGAVRLAEERQRVVAEPGAEPVEVPRRLARRNVREQRPGVASARVHHALCRVHQTRVLRGRLGREALVEERIDVDGAGHGRGSAAPPRIERDEVEAVAHAARQRLRSRPQVAHARRAGSARVDDERADPALRVARPHACHADVDRRERGVTVVERDREGRALEPVTARAP
jgi:hypothetical protein